MEEVLNKTAFQNALTFLYHWQRFNPEHVKDIIKTNTVRFSDPNKFNDPWDCKSFYDTTDCYDPVKRIKILDWVEYICKTRTSKSINEIKQLRHQLDTNISLLEKTINELSVKVSLGIESQNRVYCLGVDPANILMWSHYGDSHKGVCLEFKVSDESPIGAALRCEYLSNYPKLEVYNYSESHHLKPLLSKAEVWFYEQEYRIISEERAQSNTPGMIITEDGFLELPFDALQSIIVGCKADYDAVRDLVKRENPAIKVKRAIMKRSKYELEIV